MLLLITFIAHSLLNYLNKRLKPKHTLKVVVDQNSQEDETEMFLFNESSFDNLAGQFDYTTVSIIPSNIINSTFDSLIKPIDVHDINEEEYFELNSQHHHVGHTTTAYDNLTEKNYDFEMNTTLNSDDSSTCSESVYNLSEFTLPKLTKSNSFRYSMKCFNRTSLRRAKVNRYLKSRSLVVDLNKTNNSSFDSIKSKRVFKRSSNIKYTSGLKTKFNKQQTHNLRKRTSTLKSNSALQSSHSSGSLLVSHHRRHNLSQTQPQNNTYKPPIKIEKLLNDTRGMRKYLIDYDCLMSNKTATANLNETTKHLSNDSLIGMTKFSSSFLNDDTDIIYQSLSNRCSSGYLSDC